MSHHVAERLGPLRRPPEIEELHALEEHRVVHDARDDRPDLVRRHRDHDGVELGEATGDISHRDHGLPMTERGERPQVGIAETVPEIGGAGGEISRRCRVTGFERTQEAGDEHVSARRALLSDLLREALAACEPPAACAICPRSIRVNEIQKAHRAASATSPVAAARCAASQAFVLSSSRPIR